MFERLPETVRELEVRWSIVVGEVLYGAEASSAWIARASRADGTSVIPPDRLRRRAPSRQHKGLIYDAGPSALYIARIACSAYPSDRPG